jgi:hypothetical protein
LPKLRRLIGYLTQLLPATKQVVLRHFQNTVLQEPVGLRLKTDLPVGVL